MQFFLKGDTILGSHFKHDWYSTTALQNSSNSAYESPTTPKHVRAFLGFVGYYRKFIKGFAKVAKPLTLLTRQQINSNGHQTIRQPLNI